jgi:2-phospho-L-lactate guanylyltransferase
MHTIAILPIKSFGAAKQRLADSLGGGSRQALAQAMFSDVLGALRHAPELDAIAVVTANPTARMAAGRTGAIVLDDPDEAGQSPAAAIGVRHALQHGFERAVLVPGDTPLLDPQELAGLLARSGRDGMPVAIVPDRHGTGTNALVLRPPDAIEPSFGPDSLARHVAAAVDAGLEHRIEELSSLMLDVDTPDDLAALGERLDERRGQAAQTRGTLRQIERLRAGSPPFTADPGEPGAAGATSSAAGAPRVRS